MDDGHTDVERAVGTVVPDVPVDRTALLAACRRIEHVVGSDPRYAHTSHLRITVAGNALFDRHYRGPEVADVFSVTKTVLATLVGIAVGRGEISDLDAPLGTVLNISGTPAQAQTWRHLLTMTRGCRTEGPWDIDAIMAMPGGWTQHIAEAPQLDEPGTRFRYDDAGTHLLAAALTAATGRDIPSYAAEHLFAPLGISDAHWPVDPDGIGYGFGHLRLSAAALTRLGELWLARGRHGGAELLPRRYAEEMTTAQNAGGPPENRPYGFLIWVDHDGVLLAGGWAGQHVVMVRAAEAVVVTTGDPQFDAGPPPTDRLPPDWRPALDLVRRELLPCWADDGRDAAVRRPAATGADAARIAWRRAQLAV